MWIYHSFVIIILNIQFLEFNEAKDSVSLYFPPKCQSNFTLHGSYCYRLYHRLEWFHEALHWCEIGHKGAYLVTIHSEEENEFLMSLLLKENVTDVWIGLLDEYNQRQYHWGDESQMDYTKWYHYEPALKPYGGCVNAKLKNHSLNWYDSICRINKKFICKRNAYSKLRPEFYVIISIVCLLVVSILLAYTARKLRNFQNYKDLKKKLDIHSISYEKYRNETDDDSLYDTADSSIFYI